MIEIKDREFDWYCLDLDENIAMFATGGCGIAPEVVLENYEAYDEISDTIEESNIGTKEVWLNHARLGFFVFETNTTGLPFVKRASPSNPMNIELKSKILAINNLPKLNILFREINEIYDVQYT